MTRSRTLIQFLYIVIVIVFNSCDSLKKSLEIETPDISSYTGQIPSKSITADIDQLPNNKKLQLKDYISSSTGSNLSDYYNESYIDSIRAVLIQTGSLKINILESFLLDYIKTGASKDTIYLTNLALRSPINGETKTFNYDVKKDDIIFYEITNTNPHKLKKIEIKEGNTTRFLKNNLKKRQTVEGQIKISSENTLSLEISNDNFIKNKGLFKSNIDISIKKLTPDIKFNAEIRKDTIVETRLVERLVNDTIFNLIDQNVYNLAARLDLTSRHSRSFEINIDEFETLLGWGYWIGIGKDDIAQFNSLSSEENPLITFSKYELIKLENPMQLPNSSNNDVKLTIKNESLDVRSLNYSDNFAFYISDNFTEKNAKKAEIFLSNHSTLYDYNVSHYVVAVGIKEKKSEIMKDIIATKEYIYITLLEDE